MPFSLESLPPSSGAPPRLTLVPPDAPSLRSGDADAFARAVLPHFARLAALARRILGSPDLASDAVQEALIGLWNAGTRPADPARWLARAVIHRSLHASRTRSRRHRHERCACCERKEAGHGLDPAAICDRREMAERVEKALGALPREQRDVLVLRLVDGLEYDTIARRLSIPIGTVRSRINRGRAALCRILDCSGPTPEAEGGASRLSPSFSAPRPSRGAPPRPRDPAAAAIRRGAALRSSGGRA